MRTLNKNKQILHYANQIGRVPIYEKDAQGAYRTINVDGRIILVETGDYENGYSDPVEFLGNITLSGGEVHNVEFGVDASAYDAILIVDKEVPKLSETSLIWHKSPLVYKDIAKTFIEPTSADYRVSRVSTSINCTKYLLKKVIKNG